jgi:tetratricopeptide (TPR) repeat protein
MSKSNSDGNSFDVYAAVEHFRSLYTEALELSKNGEYQKAVEKYDEAIAIGETSGCYINKGHLLNKMGRYKEALEALNRAIEIDPDDSAAHNNRGNSLWDLAMQEENPVAARELYDQAIAAYDRAIEIDPDDTVYLCNKGKVLQIIGDERGALACFNQAYELMQSGEAQKETRENAIFVETTLSQDREILLEKLIKLQEANIKTGELISTLDPDDPETQIVVKELDEIRHETSGFISAYATADDSKISSEENTRQAKEIDNLLQKVAKLEARLDQHDTDIIDIKLSQEQISSILGKLEIEDASARKEISSFLNKLNTAITGAVPDHIAQDSYKNAFYNTLQRDLNATYIAAMSVQTDIVANSKKSPLLGKMGSILSVAGEYIPTLGGGVMLLGAILSAVDQRQQDAMVKRFAEMAVNPVQMGIIASNIVQILTQDEFINLFSGDDDSLNAKLSGYLMSFLQGVYGGTTKSAKAAASNMAMDVMQQMGVTVVESAMNKTIHKSKIFSLKKVFTSKKKSAAEDRDQEELKFSPNIEKSQGEKDAHMVSAIIISKIYKGEISADGRPEDIAKSMAYVMFGHFDLGAGVIESLLSVEVSHTQIAFMPAVVAAASDEETGEDTITTDILARIGKRVPITEEFKSAFISAMSSRLKTTTSQNDVKFIESLQSSFDFAEMFKAHASEAFVTKLKANKTFIPNLKTVKTTLQEIEAELREEGEFKTVDGRILVWSARIEYDNPFLNHPELLQLAREIGIDPLMLINIGDRSPEFAKGILNGVETYGPEFVLNAVFGITRDDGSSVFDDVTPEEVSVAGEIMG